MKSVLRWGCAPVLAFFLMSSNATAAPIGFFSFDVDADPNIGPFFTVENFSDPGETFTAVVIQLFAGVTFVTDLFLGDIDPFGLVQSLDDLRALSFDSAVLRFDFPNVSPQAVSLDNLSFVCDDLACTSPMGGPFSAAIELPADPGPGPAPVPEPSALVLLATGLGVMARAVRRRRAA